MSATHSSGHGDDHGGHHGGHRPLWHYIVIAVILSILTLIELGPLFDWYNLPAPVLIALSVVKFFTVVAFFMHLWDDESVFTQVFGAPLIGSILMVIVLMLLFFTFNPSPRSDSPVIAERHWSDYSGECSSWLRSHVSNKMYCASPPFDSARLAMYNKDTGKKAVPKIDFSKQEEVVKFGEEVYKANCVVCHQANGEGVPNVYPPLAGSDYFGDGKNHATIIIKGLSGEITVKGQKYNGVMASFGGLSDVEIAAVATYERNSWGNSGSIVTPEEVKAAR